MTVYRFRTYQLAYGASDDQKRFAYASAQRQVSNQLYEILMNHPLPAVVDIKEEIISASEIPDYPTFHDVLEMQVEVMPVQHRYVTLTYADGRYHSYSKEGILYHLRWIWNIMWRKVRR